MVCFRLGAEGRQRLPPENAVARPEKLTDPFTMKKLSQWSCSLARLSWVDDQLKCSSLKHLDVAEQ